MYQTTAWNRLRVAIPILSAGFGVTGLTVPVSVYRVNDQKWFYSGAWNVSHGTFNAAEVDSTNLPGVYAAAISAANLDHALGVDGYVVTFTVPSLNIREVVQVSVVPDARVVVDTLLQSQATGVGSFTSGTAPTSTATNPVGNAIQAAGFGGGHPVFDVSTSAQLLMMSTTTAHASRFYPTSTTGSVTAARCGSLVGARVRRFKSNGTMYVERIASVSTDYFTLEQDDGTAPSASIASGDAILITPPTEFAHAYLARTPIDAATASAGTLADFVRRMIRLRNHNERTVYTSFNASGQPTAGSILLYTSASDANSDTGPSWSLAVGKYDFTMTYDVSGRLTEYKSTKTS